MMNPNTMIKNQLKAVDREKHGRNLDNTGSIQDQTMMAPPPDSRFPSSSI
jgi:hypothetical protein